MRWKWHPALNQLKSYYVYPKPICVSFFLLFFSLKDVSFANMEAVPLNSTVVFSVFAVPTPTVIGTPSISDSRLDDEFKHLLSIRNAPGRAVAS
jgi:hypothetical protein